MLPIHRSGKITEVDTWSPPYPSYLNKHRSFSLTKGGFYFSAGHFIFGKRLVQNSYNYYIGKKLNNIL